MMLLLAAVLTSVLLVYAEDPNNFACDMDSPSGKDVYSEDEPKVNLVHIFCGQIDKKTKKAKKAVGFHSHPGGKDPDCARASDVSKKQQKKNSYMEFTAYNKVEVWHGYFLWVFTS